ncbi:hypothetical protein Q31b_40680 [Novipirellula aureliae]|uniref:DUF481 domain-containing protein n=1 Tax=Novipirellula aureliae TaxID=2527966 RepID=A0A5C6DVY7_9BACT|nr:hypothetical protein [Novipirellula aureliae]TWU38989.1 hypothetical protein Q31b_40680 [Novipirellula aureliae]
MRYTLPLLITTLSVLFPGFAQAQSTISNSPFDLTGSVGAWITDLPNYDLGTASDGSSAFSDSLDDFGGIVRIDAVRRALGTRTSFEGNLFYAWADGSSNGTAGDISILNPADGVAAALAGASPNVDSSVRHYGGDAIIRDTWQTRFGGLSAGVAYSLMAFDQDFDLYDGATRLFDESLDSDFQGAKIVSGWDGYLFGRASQLDFNVGIYDMNADYVASSGSVTATAIAELEKTTYTIETGFTTWSKIRGIDVAWNVNVMYIADMPTIERTAGSAASLGTDDAVTVSCMCEFLLY